ncbi:MAG: acyltransferase family protein [Gammaproteobacteria bacterium]
MNWKALDKIDSDLYRGIAILMIATHNFMHLFPAPRENEFEFDPDRFFIYLGLLSHEPENGVRTSLSFFGHYGVQIFIFLSAYGLTKKYLPIGPGYWPFIRQRILKIYPAFILAILLWAVIAGGPSGLSGPFRAVYWNAESLLLKLTLLSNFLPGKSLSPVGPWWFIPFIFQFYFLFPLLLKMHSRWGGSVLWFLSALSILLAIASQGHLGSLNIYFTVLGHLPEFCLGIHLAKCDDAGLHIPFLWIMGAFALFVLGNIHPLFWHVSHVSALIVLLAALNVSVPIIERGKTIKQVILFFGALSMPLFLVNGFLREPYLSWAIQFDHWLLTIALCLASLTASVVAALALSKLESRIRVRLDSMVR